MKFKTSCRVLITLWIVSLCNVAWAAEYQGVLDWSERYALAMPVSGVVKKVHVEVGDKVQHKQKLVELDGRGFQAHINQARASLSETNAIYEEAGREMERGQEMFDRSAISIHDLQLIKIDLTRSKAARQQAQAQVTQALLDMENSVIRAPVDGIVVQRHVQIKQTVVSRQLAETLMVVANNQRMLANVFLSATEIAGIKKGQSATVKIQGQSIAGTIRSVAQEPLKQGSEVLYQVSTEFANPGELRKGQAVSVQMP